MEKLENLKILKKHIGNHVRLYNVRYLEKPLGQGVQICVCGKLETEEGIEGNYYVRIDDCFRGCGCVGISFNIKDIDELNERHGGNELQIVIR